MAKLKTRETQADVEAFLENVASDKRREDGRKVLEMMRRITGWEPKMWGPSIVGFGQYHYKYESGREGDFFVTGFSPRKSALTVYIMPGYRDYSHLLEKLGNHRTGKSCLYVNKLEDIDMDVLAELITESVEHMKENYDVQ